MSDCAERKNRVAANLVMSERVTYEDMLPPTTPLVRWGFEASGNIYNAIRSFAGAIAGGGRKKGTLP